MKNTEDNLASRGLHQLPHDLYGRTNLNTKHDFGAYVWLAYSVFFFIEPLICNSVRYWLQQLPVFVIFLGLYIAYVEYEGRLQRRLIVAAIFALGVASIPFNMGGSSFFIYVAALLPFCIESAAVLIAAMLLEVATLVGESYLTHNNPYNFLITGSFVVIVGMSNLMVAKQKRMDCKLRAAQEENVALAAVAERERIARDLHDVLGHTLSVIVLKAELAGRLMGRDDARAAVEIADVERTARTALAEVREAIGGYRAKGLRAEVEQARMMLDAAGVALECDAATPELHAREETVMALAMREAVTNIVRHARATKCVVRFATTADGFCSMSVSDDGIAEAVREGNGLRGMRERVEELGGRLRFAVEHGMMLVVEVPAGAAR